MMAKGHPKAGGIPGRRSARASVVPESFDKQTLCWHIGLIDWDHKDWGWRRLSPRNSKPLLEEWRDIPGYEGQYQASSLGRIKSLAGVSITHARYQDIILSPVKHHTGYHIYSIGPKGKSIYGHKLVALAFLGEPEEDQVVCHFDGSRDNNRADNLRYDTRSGNEQDKLRHGTYQEVTGNPRSVLTEGDTEYQAGASLSFDDCCPSHANADWENPLA